MAARNLWWIGLALLAACASQPKRDEVFMAQLVATLPGSYDNLAQSRASPAHAALHLMVAPVQAPLVGRHVFYVQEMAAGDARRVLAQKLFVLHPVEGAERAVLVQADFAETSRWRDGHLNRDLFKSLLPQDLRPRGGCDLVITRGVTGFSGSGGSACRIASAGTGETLRVELRLELDTDGLALFELQRDATGNLLDDAGGDPWYRYARRADAPW